MVIKNLKVGDIILMVEDSMNSSTNGTFFKITVGMDSDGDYIGSSLSDNSYPNYGIYSKDIYILAPPAIQILYGV